MSERFPSPHSFVSLIWNPRRNNSSTPQVHLRHTHRLMGISTGNSFSTSEHCEVSLAAEFRFFFLLALTTIYLVFLLSNSPPLWRCHHSTLLGCSKAPTKRLAHFHCPLCVDKSKQNFRILAASRNWLLAGRSQTTLTEEKRELDSETKHNESCEPQSKLINYIRQTQTTVLMINSLWCIVSHIAYPVNNLLYILSDRIQEVTNNTVPLAVIEQPAASNQQPTASNLQPASWQPTNQPDPKKGKLVMRITFKANRWNISPLIMWLLSVGNHPTLNK